MQVTYDPNLDDEEPSTLKVWLKRILIALVGLSVLAAIGYGISQLTSGGAPQKKQVTNDYAGGDVKIGSDGGAKFNWYAGLVKSQIENALEKDKKITEGQYKLVVNVWLKPNGDIEKLDVVQSDAKSETEQAIKEALRNMPAMREAPPEGMPQPIKLRISARKLG
jgi:hypothetical protein